ncbi:MAG: hypothetical protein ACTSU5_12715 [Promethearchaeota archaeon]
MNLRLRREGEFDEANPMFVPFRVQNMGPANKMYVQGSLAPALN